MFTMDSATSAITTVSPANTTAEPAVPTAMPAAWSRGMRLYSARYRERIKRA